MSHDEIKKYVEKTINDEKGHRHLGHLTVDALSKTDLFFNGDYAVVTGIPYDKDKKEPGRAKIGNSNTEVRNGDMLVYSYEKKEWVILEETPFEEHTISRITDLHGNVVKLPFPVTVTTSRFDEHGVETALMQVIKKLSDRIIEKEAADA